MDLTAGFLKFAISTGSQWILYLLIFCSVLNIVIIVDRVIYFKKLQGDFGFFVQQLTQRLAAKDSFENVAAWCSGQNTFESQVATIGLEKSSSSITAAEQSMNACMIAAKTKMEKGLIVLGTLGNNTPFIGLFGTIVGIMKAFHTLSESSAGGSAQIMSSIAEALTATAVGILVAIPAVVAYNFFNRSIKKKISNADATSRIILTHLADPARTPQTPWTK